MTDFRWFRLMLFALGVYFAGVGAFDVLYYTSYAIRELLLYSNGQYAGREREVILSGVVALIPHILRLTLGIYLMRGGGALTKWILKRVQVRCARCDYPLRGVPGNKCPECGMEFDRTQIDAQKSADLPAS